jgi:hypothetical protein
MSVGSLKVERDDGGGGLVDVYLQPDAVSVGHTVRPQIINCECGIMKSLTISHPHHQRTNDVPTSENFATLPDGTLSMQTG